MRNRDARRTAAVAVEMALLLPFIAMLFAMAVDFARVFHALQALQASAGRGANTMAGYEWVPAASGSLTDAAIAAAVSESSTLNPALRADQVNVNVNGNQATVTVTYDFPLFTAGLLGSGTVQLQRRSTVRIALRPGD